MVPEDYIVRATTDPLNETCYLGLTPSPEGMPIFILGDSFLRGYYSIHQDDTGMLGLVPHSLSNKKPARYEANPPHGRHINATGVADLTPQEMEEVGGGIFSVAILIYLLY